MLENYMLENYIILIIYYCIIIISIGVFWYTKRKFNEWVRIIIEKKISKEDHNYESKRVIEILILNLLALVAIIKYIKWLQDLRNILGLGIIKMIVLFVIALVIVLIVLLIIIYLISRGRGDDD
jgi:hypothetical protein